jgi:hypothetical protein
MRSNGLAASLRLPAKPLFGGSIPPRASNVFGPSHLAGAAAFARGARRARKGREIPRRRRRAGNRRGPPASDAARPPKPGSPTRSGARWGGATRQRGNAPRQAIAGLGPWGPRPSRRVSGTRGKPGVPNAQRRALGWAAALGPAPSNVPEGKALDAPATLAMPRRRLSTPRP